MSTNYLPRVSRITSGTYTGDASDNKAIPHGLGGIPKIVIISQDGQPAIAHIMRDEAGIRNDNVAFLAVTAPNATNFYVGNNANYAQTMNFNLTAYSWVAMT